MLNLHQPASRPTTDDVGLLLSQAESSAIEIASGRLLAGRPPAWTLPRRLHRRSPGTKHPLRRGFNRMPEQLRQKIYFGRRARRARHTGRPDLYRTHAPQQRNERCVFHQLLAASAVSVVVKCTCCRRLRCDVIQSAAHGVRAGRASPTCLPDSHVQKCVLPPQRCLILRRSNPSAGYIRYFVRATRRDC